MQKVHWKLPASEKPKGETPQDKIINHQTKSYLKSEEEQIFDKHVADFMKKHPGYSENEARYFEGTCEKRITYSEYF
jgi:hypothetical protein